jgi:hypothetical protein
VTVEERATQRAPADAAAALAVELANKPLTREQQRMADRATRLARRLIHLDEQRKAGHR